METRMSGGMPPDTDRPGQFRGYGGWLLVLAMLGATIGILSATWGGPGPRTEEDERPSRPGATVDHRSPTWSLAFSRDDRRLASSTVYGDLDLGDMTGGSRKTIRLGPDNAARTLAFSPDNRTLAIGGYGGHIRLLDPTSGDEVDRLDTGRRYDATHLAFSPDGRYLAVGGFAGALTLWDWDSRRRLVDLEGHLAAIEAMAFSTDGMTLATCDSAGQVKVWNIPSGEERATFRTCEAADKLVALAFSPDAALLATLSRDRRVVRLWGTSGGEPRGAHPVKASHVKALAFSADKAVLAVPGTGGTIELWGVAEARILGAFKVGENDLGAVAFSRDGRVLATGDSLGVLHIVDVAEALADRKNPADPAAGPSCQGDDVGESTNR
jgi:WD40 repeat protein